MLKNVILFTLMAAAALASPVSVTPHGKHFHTKPTCMALRSTAEPEEISQAEAEKRGLTICGICARVKGAAAAARAAKK